MVSNYFCKISTVISAFVFFVSFVSSVQSVNVNNKNRSFDQPPVESEKLKHIRDYLKKINKPAVKTIQSPDGDLIDCVLNNQQPAFDHPLLKGQKPLTAPPEMPKGPTSINNSIKENIFQVWRMSGETCPENTVPIRRVTEEDVERASSVRTFGHKPSPARQESFGANHEYAIAYVEGNYYGAEAVMDVWAPKVENPKEFSLSQIWVTAGSSSLNGDLNTIETGWQVYPYMYGDYAPRLFILWTSDGYNNGCYDMMCSGFVQINNNIVLGAAIKPVSSYGSKLYDLPFYVYKDSQNGHWWLKVNNETVGYWPSSLFTYLKNGPADMIQFGGEIINTRNLGTHTKTEMGSGHFPNMGYGKASCFKGIQVYSWMNGKNPADITFNGKFEKPRCYYSGVGSESKTLGNYFFYGGPGGSAPGCT